LAALQTLIKLGALDPRTACMTQMGSEMAILPTDPIYSRLLVTALRPEYAAVKDAVATIVAMLSVENVFYGSSSDSTTIDKQKSKAMKRRKRLLNQSSDHLSLLQVFTAWQDQATNKVAFCNEHLINIKSL
jgi:HrpA-like RNA helicase